MIANSVAKAAFSDKNDVVFAEITM